MRLILASAGIAFLASSGSAMAADCTKGLLWPYVRNPGDCLTDAEIQAGKTGVYNGPATGRVDVSTITPPPQTNSASSNAIQCSHSWYWPFGSGDCQAAPAAAASSSTGSGASAGSSASKDSPPAVLPGAQPASPAPAVKPQAAAPAVPPAVQPAQSQPVVAPPVATIQVAQTTSTECHKGILWPFVRDSGDCPTTADTGKGQTSAVPVAASTPAGIAVGQAGATTAAQSCTRSWLWPIVSDTCTENSNGQTAPVAVATMTAVAGASPSSASTCTKGTLWPFIREAGDCPTAAEKASGKTSAAPVAASAPAAMPASVAQPPPAAPATQAIAVATPAAQITCTKGTFWPFIRESGDCSTVAEKASGQASAVPMAASAPAATPVVQPNTAAAGSSSDAAACTRSWLWPFVREARDCQTTAEMGSTSTSAVPINASGPAAGPVVLREMMAPPEQTGPAQTGAPAATNPATCHKGLFWPFVREAGDCPTDADKASQHNPF